MGPEDEAKLKALGFIPSSFSDICWMLKTPTGLGIKASLYITPMGLRLDVYKGGVLKERMQWPGVDLTALLVWAAVGDHL